MSQTFFTLLTAIGEAKHANAVATGTKVNYSTMAVGDGGGSDTLPDRLQTTLVNEVRRAAINQIAIDPDNTAQIIIEQVIPENDGGWWIREVGIFDDQGDLIAVANVPSTYKPQLQEGSGRTQVVRVVLLMSSTSAVTLRIDPSIVLATQEYVNTVINSPSGVEAGQYGNESHYPIITVDARGRVTVASEVQVASVWDQVPTEHIGDIVFVKGLGEMWWVETPWLTGYKTKMCGFPAQTIDRFNRSFTLALDGGFFDRTLPKFKGLWSFINEHDLLVPQQNYVDGEFFFCEAGGNQVKTPNQDNMFWRNKGIDVDTANAAALGAHKKDQIQNITGSFAARLMTGELDIATIGGSSAGAFVTRPTVGTGSNTAQLGATNGGTKAVDFNASRVVRSGLETAPAHARVTPCIHA